MKRIHHQHLIGHVLPFILVAFINSGRAEIGVINKENKTVAVFFDVELGLGVPIDSDGIAANLVTAEPEDACRPMKVAPNSTDPNVKFFALCKRFSCSFRTKMEYAVQAGYDGLVVYNVENSQLKSKSLFNGSLTFAPHLLSNLGLESVPAVLVSNEDGLSLKNYYTYDKGYFIIVTPDFGHSLITYLLPFAIVIGICLFIMVSFMVIKCIRDRRKSRRHRLSSKHLKKLPTTKFKKGDHYDTCAICLDEYVEGEKLRVLPCGHVYHLKCIDPWLTKNRRVCPVCKAKVVLPGMADITDSESEAEAAVNERTPLVRNQPRRGRRIRRSRRENNPNSPADPSTSAVSSSNIEPAASTSGDNSITFPVTSSGHLSVNCDEHLESLPPDNQHQPLSASTSVASTVTVVEVEAEPNSEDVTPLVSSSSTRRGNNSRRQRRNRSSNNEFNV